MTIPLELEADNPAVVYLESLSEGSYWAVRHSLETIAEILAGEDTDPWTFPWETLRYQHTARVRRDLVQRYAPTTVNKMLSALRGVLKHAWRLELMDGDAYRRAVAIDNVRANVPRKGRAVTPEEIATLMKVCANDNSLAGRRDAAILAVLYGGGLRRAELCGLDLTDFDPEGCSLSVRAGKGRRDRTVYLPSRVCKHLEAWVVARGQAPGPFFCPVTSNREVAVRQLGEGALRYILNRRLAQARLDGITPHCFRRAYISGLLNAGVDLLTVQKLAGHVDALTTSLYDRRSEAPTRRAALAAWFPTTKR